MTRNWIEVDPVTGRIPRRFTSNQEPEPQASRNIVLPIEAQRGQKLLHDGMDEQGKLINPRLVYDEQANKPPERVLPNDELILIRRGDWEALLSRVESIEKKL